MATPNPGIVHTEHLRLRHHCQMGSVPILVSVSVTDAFETFEIAQCEQSLSRKLHFSNAIMNSNRVRCLIHWRIQGRRQRVPPPTGSISFIFAYIFAKRCTHRRLAPPNGLVPPQREILDLPLL